MTDHLGTPQELYDEQREVVWAADLSAYGRTARWLTRVVDNPIRFPGQYRDEESGLHYNRFRYYDPMVGRYINQDPIGLQGGRNLYVYVRGNPTVGIDPLGLQARGPVLLGMGHLYRADTVPPRPVIVQDARVGPLLNDISNNAISADVLPGVWPGVNIPVDVPRFYCATGYYGDDPLSELRPTDDSGLTCKARPKKYDQSYSVFGEDPRNFTCTLRGVL
ncbi:Rhs family protein [Burkholderia sp. TJI49]|nr:Rhs family protein [Burkholderia sp. TJI49]